MVSRRKCEEKTDWWSQGQMSGETFWNSNHSRIWSRKVPLHTNIQTNLLAKSFRTFIVMCRFLKRKISFLYCRSQRKTVLKKLPLKSNSKCFPLKGLSDMGFYPIGASNRNSRSQIFWKIDILQNFEEYKFFTKDSQKINKKLSFPLMIFPVNVTKSAGNCGFV